MTSIISILIIFFFLRPILILNVHIIKSPNTVYLFTIQERSVNGSLIYIGRLGRAQCKRTTTSYSDAVPNEKTRRVERACINARSGDTQRAAAFIFFQRSHLFIKTSKFKLYKYYKVPNRSNFLKSERSFKRNI